MKYLAVADGGGTIYLEDSAAAVAHAIVHDLEVAHFLITLDPDTLTPILSERVTLANGPRTVVRRIEQVGLKAGTRDIEDTEITTKRGE